MVATGFDFLPRKLSGIRWYDVVGLDPASRLLAAVSTRHGGVSLGELGSLNLGGSVDDEPSHVRVNRDRLFRALSVDERKVSYVRQVHGCRVVESRETGTPGVAEGNPIEADAQMTDRPGVSLFLTFADCVPIFVYDPVRHVVGLAHAGWRGTVAEVGGRLVDAMGERYGCLPNDLRAAIGPAIGHCCYEVGEDVAREFKSRWPGSVVTSRSPRMSWQVDLWDANRRQLIAAGLTNFNVFVTGVCTACRVDEFFSHRGQAGRAGRFAAIAMLR
jgi:YfiH family protein